MSEKKEKTGGMNEVCEDLMLLNEFVAACLDYVQEQLRAAGAV